MTNLSILVLALAAALTPQRAYATDARGRGDAPLRHSAITFNPFALMYGAADFQVETRRSPAAALAIRANVGGGSRTDWSRGYFGAGFAWRMYPDRHALSGFYWGPGAAMALGRGAAIGPSLEGGVQFVLDGGFAFDLGAGAVWYFGPATAYAVGPFGTRIGDGLRPFLRLALGYAWR